MQSVIEYLKMHMEMGEDSNVCTVPVKHEPYASNKNRSGCTRNNFLKLMLTNKHLTYPPRNTCGLFESLVTPNTSGIKSPLKLKMQNNFSSAWAIPGAAIGCSLVNLYLVIWQFPTQLWRMFSCVTFSEFWIAELLAAAASAGRLHYAIPLIFQLCFPCLLLSISHRGSRTVEGIFAHSDKPVRFLLHKTHQKKNGPFSAWNRLLK